MASAASSDAIPVDDLPNILPSERPEHSRRFSEASSHSEPVCRVCRSEATPDQALFHPCKCSGSIKYIHQDCLVEWLKHSQKEHCELCKFRFQFTKLYASDMPKRIPLPLFISRGLSRAARHSLVWLRSLLVSLVWLCFIPWTTRWSWRILFWFGDGEWAKRSTLSPTATANQDSLFQHAAAVADPTTSLAPASLESAGLWILEKIAPNVAVDTPQPVDMSKAEQVSSLLSNYVSSPRVNKILTDCFQGQIITGALIVVFVIIFLIREWVIQNALGAVMDAVREVRENGQGAQNLRRAILAGRGDQAEAAQPPLDDVHEAVTEELLLAESALQNLERVTAGETVADDSTTDTTAMSSSHAQTPQGNAPSDVTGDPATVGPSSPGPLENSVYQPLVAQEPPQQDLPGPPVPAALAPEIADVQADARADAQPEAPDDAFEDLDGVMDILGMRGPLIVLFQHAFFSFAFILFFIAFGICLPYTWGRVALHALTNPQVILFKFPVALTSTTTNWLGDFILGLWWTLVYWFALAMELSRLHFRFFEFTLDTEYLRLLAVSKRENLSLVWNAVLSDVDRLHYTSSVLGGPNISLTERMLAVAIGYAILTSLGALYVSQRKARGRASERMFRDCLRQAGAVLKVIVIISIELVVFPIFCGILIDLSTFPIWEQVSISERQEFWSQHPAIASLLNWFVGTVYMFNLALFVNMTREIMRPGVLYMIRDPNDPSFHPVKDILDRSILTQLRKIALSALIYFVFIVLCIGTTVYTLRALTGDKILPLRWNTRESIFDAPLDFFGVYGGLPFTASVLNCAVKFKQMWTSWYRKSAAKLRLTSFLFGGRPQGEEYTHGFFRRGSNTGDDNTDVSSDAHPRSGGFLRVPATDLVGLNQRRRQLVVRVTELNDRLDHVRPDATRNDPNFTVVYVPPAFKFRLLLFAIFAWLFNSFVCLAVVVVPLIFGRHIFERTLGESHQMHDLYAYSAGFHVLGFTILLMDLLARRWTRLLDLVRTLRSYACGPNRLASHAYRYIQMVLGAIYIYATFSIVVPSLFALNMDLYLVLPFRKYVINSGESTVVNVIHDWALGLLYLRLLMRFLLANGETRYARALHNVVRNGWLRPDTRAATFQLIIPVIVPLLVALLLPPALAFQLQCCLKLPLLRQLIWNGLAKFDYSALQQPLEVWLASPELYRDVYPIFATCAGIGLSVKSLISVFRHWHQSVRDEIYLVGELLHNHGEEGEEDNGMAADEKTSAGNLVRTAQ